MAAQLQSTNELPKRAKGCARLNRIKMVIDLFSVSERWRLAGLLGATVVMALLETIGVASIMPFMALVTNPDILDQSRILGSMYRAGGFGSIDRFIFVVGCGVLVLIAFGNAFTAFTTWAMLRFTWRKTDNLSQQLLRQYLSEPYSFYLTQNTSNLSKTLLSEVTVAINGVVMPMLRITGSIIVTCFLLTLLFALDPALALTTGLTLGGAYSAIYAAVRRRQGLLGTQRAAANGQRYKVANEALAGIKDVKVLGREDHFLSRFVTPSGVYSDTSASNSITSQIPRYALETIAFGGILLIVLYFQQRGNIAGVLPVISLYALAAYRLMPSLQMIFTGITTIRFNSAGLEDLHRDLKVGSERTLRAVQQEAIPFEHEIRFDRVTFRYSAARSPVLDELSFKIAKRTTVGLVGATGAGKTTIADLLLGLYFPESGAVNVDGMPLTEASIGGWRPHIGYVPQQIFLCDDTLTRNIAFGIPEGEVDEASVERSARVAHLHDFITTLPEGYQTIVGERGIRLSGGQRQRIGRARALYHDPDVLVMDEATSALDGITEDVVLQAIKELGGKKTIILIAHRLSTVEECDNIILLEQGKIVAEGTYSTLLASNSTFRRMARHMASAARE